MELRSMMIAGIMLLGSAVAQQPAAPKTQPSPKPKAQSQTPATKLPEAPAAKTDANSPFATKKEKDSYALGMNFGDSFRRQSIEIDADVFLHGLRDAMAGGKTLMTEDEVRATLTQLQNELRAKQEEMLKQLADKNKKEGEAFLAANKSKEGVVTLPSGLQYKILTTGSGAKPGATDTVVCNYKGTFIDGTEFDSSAKHGGPQTLTLGRVIRGWTEGLQLMPVGSKWQFVIPPDLAYGDQGNRGMEPNKTLIFEVELVSIQEKPPAPASAPAAAPKPTTAAPASAPGKPK